MGNEAPHQSMRFDLSDLGLLDGSADHEFDVITRCAVFVLHVRAVYFTVLDEMTGSVLRRSQHVRDQRYAMPERSLFGGSICAHVVGANKLISTEDVGATEEFGQLTDSDAVPFTSFLSAPVHGPAGEPVGALTAVCARPRVWTTIERGDIRDHAHLLSRHILLRASLETLKRVSRERDELKQVPRFRN